MNAETIFTIIFYLIIAVLIYINRKKITIIEKIFIAFKTRKPIKIMKKLAKYSFFWKTFSTISIPFALIGMIVILVFLTQSAISLIRVPSSTAGVGIAIPGVKIPGSPIYIPFWYGILSILILSTVHEFSHAVTGIVEKVKVKSSGFGMLAIIPAAFVEFDTKSMMKASKLSRLRIASAGPVANIALSFFLIFLLSWTFYPLIESIVQYNGIEIVSTIKGYPAEASGISKGMVINKINGTQLNTSHDFMEYLRKLKPNDYIVLTTKDGKNYGLKLTSSPKNESLAYIGITHKQFFEYKEGAWAPKWLYSILIWLSGLFGWLINLNFAIGMINFLPVWFADGGQIFYNFAGYFFKDEKTLTKVVSSVFFFSLSLLLLNFLLPFF